MPVVFGCPEWVWTPWTLPMHLVATRAFLVAGPFLTPLVGEPILGVEFLAFGAAYIGSSPYFEFAT